MNLATKDAESRSTTPATLFAGKRQLFHNLLVGVYLWLCLINLPATTVRDCPPQRWEPVLSFAAAHHLQWGRDIVFTYGPLGFLASDYYWGDFFWEKMFWSLGSAALLSAMLVKFSSRLPILIRALLLAATPLLVTPGCMDLGFDPLCFLSITLVGVACLAQPKPGAWLPIVPGR